MQFNGDKCKEWYLDRNRKVTNRDCRMSAQAAEKDLGATEDRMLNMSQQFALFAREASSILEYIEQERHRPDARNDFSFLFLTDVTPRGVQFWVLLFKKDVAELE